MEAHVLARAASRTCVFSAPIRSRILPTSASSPATLSLTTIRTKATANRTKRALNIPPHPSFLASDSHAAQNQDHIVFNPPSSAASVYHTPFKFLPKSDPRRRANLTSLFSSSTTISFGNGNSGVSEAALAPKVEHETYTADRHHLTKEQVEEIRRLRSQDPEEFSVLKLSRKYNCSPIFVMMACRSSAEHKAAMKERLAKQKERWGPIRTQARIDRRKRKVMLLRGEL